MSVINACARFWAARYSDVTRGLVRNRSRYQARSNWLFILSLRKYSICTLVNGSQKSAKSCPGTSTSGKRVRGSTRKVSGFIIACSSLSYDRQVIQEATHDLWNLPVIEINLAMGQPRGHQFPPAHHQEQAIGPVCAK